VAFGPLSAPGTAQSDLLARPQVAFFVIEAWIARVGSLGSETEGPVHSPTQGFLPSSSYFRSHSPRSLKEPFRDIPSRMTSGPDSLGFPRVGDQGGAMAHGRVAMLDFEEILAPEPEVLLKKGIARRAAALLGPPERLRSPRLSHPQGEG
jgi:hypothetical protein